MAVSSFFVGILSLPFFRVGFAGQVVVAGRGGAVAIRAFGRACAWLRVLVFGVQCCPTVFAAGVPGTEAVRMETLVPWVVTSNRGFLLDESGAGARVKEAERRDFLQERDDPGASIGIRIRCVS